MEKGEGVCCSGPSEGLGLPGEDIGLFGSSSEGVPMDFEANVRAFIDGVGLPKGPRPDLRYASFDYCFNYFQSFRESGAIPELASPERLQESCLQLGFYLANWGMYRGSADLLQRSARYLVPTIEVIAGMDSRVWEIDADGYDQTSLDLLMGAREALGKVLPEMTDTLYTKIMLGVFGNVPAFDQFVMRGLGVWRCEATALARVSEVYRENADLVEKYRVPTLDFVTGGPTHRRYTRAKVIDMALFVEGFRGPRK